MSAECRAGHFGDLKVVTVVLFWLPGNILHRTYPPSRGHLGRSCPQTFLCAPFLLKWTIFFDALTFFLLGELVSFKIS